MISIKLVVSAFALLGLLGQSEAMPTGPEAVGVELSNVEGAVQWSEMQAKIWKDEECKDIGTFGNLNFELDECKEKCQATPTCTAVNYNNVNKHCVPRGCTKPVPAPQWQHGDYRGYYIISA